MIHKSHPTLLVSSQSWFSVVAVKKPIHCWDVSLLSLRRYKSVPWPSTQKEGRRQLLMPECSSDLLASFSYCAHWRRCVEVWACFGWYGSYKSRATTKEKGLLTTPNTIMAWASKQSISAYLSGLRLYYFGRALCFMNLLLCQAKLHNYTSLKWME